MNYILYLSMIWVIERLPHALTLTLGRWIVRGKLFFSKDGEDVQAIRKTLNYLLEHTASEEEKAQLLRQTFENFSRYLIDFFYFGGVSCPHFKGLVKWENELRLKSALDAGRGVILLTCHMGHWELGGLSLGDKGYLIHVVALEHKDSKVNALFKKRRSGKGLEVIPLGLATRHCLEVLRSGELLGLLADRVFDPAEKVLTVPFCSGEIKVPRGPAYLAVKTGAIIGPCHN